MADSFTTYEVLVDRYGKKHKVYPAKLAWKDEIRRLTPKFNDAFILANCLIPNYENGEIMRDEATNDIIYNDEAFDAMLEIVYLALDEKETKEEILKWLDAELARQAIEVFYNISNLKKNNLQMK